MHSPGADTVLVRHGEVGVKSGKVQRAMERRLRTNLAAILDDRGVAHDEVERQWTRLLVRTDEGSVEAATDAAADTFGVVSASPAVSVEPAFDAILDALAAAGRACYRGGSFAVSARRAGGDDAHPFTSQDLQDEGGRAVWEAVEDEFQPMVDLDSPDVTFYVECRENEAFVFTEKRLGPGGLPLGTQGRLVALVSGGIDSPVAAWEAMKRGADVVPVYLDLGDYGGPDHEARALETVRTLADYAPNADLDLRVVRAGDEVGRIVEAVEDTRMLSFRRFMFRVAEHIAEREGAHGIVTGEAIGQKSSQTTANLRATAAATDLPIHRPLLSMDKTDITDRARAIGTFHDSTIPAGCNRIAPDYPETNATLDQVEAAEPDDLFEWSAAAAERVEVVPVRPEEGVEAGDEDDEAEEEVTP
jgi:thiamine biosynthesis protein ThiI